MYVCTPYAYSAFRGQRGAPDPLELEEQAAANCNVDAENQIQIL